MTNKEKMLSGNYYLASDKELTVLRKKVRKKINKYNKINLSNDKKRRRKIKYIFNQVGINCSVNSPLYLDYGINISVGDNFYSNYNLTIIDVCKVKIGNNCMFGPNVTITTATHPIHYEVRNTNLEYGKSILIKDNVWIGANVVINPGVTIGNNVVIGSNSVVTKDIKDNYIAFGNPAKEYKKINKNEYKDEFIKKDNYFKTIK